MPRIRNYFRVIMTGLLLVSILVVPGFLHDASALGRNRPNKLKNIIVMIGDGMGFNQVDAASYYQYNDTGFQIYEDFPVQLAMSTYSQNGSYNSYKAWDSFSYVKSGATDSAAAATAIATGFKTYNGAIGVISGSGGIEVQNVIERAEELGKATGVVTSVLFSHATPAAFVAHNASRGNYSDIANEMIMESAIEVIMGCGNPWYDNDGNSLLGGTPNSYKYVGGQDTWDSLVEGNLTDVADADRDGIPDMWSVIQSREQFQEIAQGPTPKRVLGIPQVYLTLQQRRNGDSYASPYEVPSIQTVPTLAEMTEAALNILDEDPDGLLLMIEGGAIDWASHGNQTGRMIEEQIDFNAAVEAVVEWVKRNSNWGETLLIVTADHETGYLLGNGSNPTWESITGNGVGEVPNLEWHSTGHTNSLVPIFAKGSTARYLRKEADEQDLVYGPYIDNTKVAKVIFNCLEL